MKKLLLSAVALVAISPALNAAVAGGTLKDNVGIGLGTMIFDGHDGLVSQVSAATTNGSFGNQTFAITSGTSNARPYAGFWAKNERVNSFTADNFDVLAREIAAGSGESLDSLAELMNIPTEKRAEFARTLQAHFAEIFTSTDVTHADLLSNLDKFAPAT